MYPLVFFFARNQNHALGADDPSYSIISEQKKLPVTKNKQKNTRTTMISKHRSFIINDHSCYGPP